MTSVDSCKLASKAARELTGLFCIHKPSGITTGRLKYKILHKLSHELSTKFKPQVPRQYFQIVPQPQLSSVSEHLRVKTIENTVTENLQDVENTRIPLAEVTPNSSDLVMHTDYNVIVRPNFADLPIVSGDPVLPEDFKFGFLKYLGFNTSGLLLAGINLTGRAMNVLKTMKWGRTYQVHGEFGIATDTCWSPDVQPSPFQNGVGRVLERSTYGHLTAKRLEGLLVSVQANYMKAMLMNEKIDLESEAAYELAVSGLLFPGENLSDLSDPRYEKDSQSFGITDIRLVNFKSPHFVLELQCIGDKEEWISELIHDIGLRMKTNAVCRKIICIKHGPFTNQMGLLQKHWTHAHILNAIEDANEVLLSTI
ncbi:pseudouridylate synthase TRUB2, mitochondrial-like isoform X2 [Artemia franciscana]